jgi:four helix bundle protein
MGSANEVEYLLLLARDLGYIDQETYADLHEKVTEVKRMLAGFIKTLKK